MKPGLGNRFKVKKLSDLSLYFPQCFALHVINIHHGGHLLFANKFCELFQVIGELYRHSYGVVLLNQINK